MRILFDIVHPAHVHFFKHMIWGMQARGHHTALVARHKDVTLELLDYYGFDYIAVGCAGPKSRWQQLRELLERDRAIWRLAKRFKPDVILTRNPCGVQVARALGVTGIFDTDDGRAADLHFRTAAPFAHIITSPDCLPERYGSKHVTYPGYKQTAYLHPDHFTPNLRVRDFLGLQETEVYFIVRFVSMTSSHDTHESGLSDESKEALIAKLSQHGRIFISSENDLPDKWASMRIAASGHLIHDAMASATLVVGDSQTMAAEAAVLGTPCIRVSSFARRLSPLNEIERCYGLVRSYEPTETQRFLAKIDELLLDRDALERMKEKHAKLLADKCNVADWFIRYLEGMATRKASRT